MKSIIGKVTASLFAVMIAAAALPFSAQAEEKKLPSGISFDEIQSEIEAYAADKKYASFETAVFCGDDTIYTGCFGETDVENKIAADEESVYDWGSITKTLTWVSVLQLYEEGKLDLNEDIRTYLPDGFIKHAKYDDPITMMNLMNHNAGWCESTYDIFVYDENELEDLGTMLQKVEPAQTYRPGERMAYSNYGAGLAGYVVECVSGESYVDYVNNHIFEPLGMENTSVAPDYSDNESVKARREKLKTYVESMDGGVMPGGTSMAYVMVYPAGSACGTIGDMVKYGQALVDDSAPLFKDKKTQAMIWEGSDFYTGTDIPRCCYGFWTEQHKDMAYWHDGSTLSCVSNLVFDPVSDVGMVFVSNTTSAMGIGMGIPDLVFGKAEKEDYPASEITDHKDISGSYFASRTYKKGIIKFMGYLSIMPITKTGEDTFDLAGVYEMTRIGDDMYIFHDSINDTDMLVSGKTLDDGSYSFNLLSEDYVQDKAAIAKTVISAIYIVSVAITPLLLFIQLITFLIRLLTKNKKHYAGSGMITLAKISKFLVLITMLMMFMTLKGGVVQPIGIAFAVANMICGVLCLISVINDLRIMITDDPERAKAVKYVFNIIFNGFIVFAVIFLETYRFWAC